MNQSTDGRQDEDDQFEILEIDGPPKAHFEIPIRGQSLGITSQRPYDIAFVERITYYGFVFHGPTLKAMTDLQEATLASIRAELRRWGGGIIWWRIRPSLAGDATTQVKKMRLGTSPDLPVSFWQDMQRSVTEKDGVT
jgi:hypothetical protein